MSIKISVIMPVYNVEKYLAKCFDSVLASTLKDIEIIAVDDGTKDNSGKIIDEYLEKDSRIIAIHKENGGYGSAINAGLEIAKGEYIAILETDDWIASNMYEILYANAKKYKADCAKGNFYYCPNKYVNNSCKFFDTLPINSPFKLRDYPEILLFAPSIWSGIYRHEFLKSNNIKCTLKVSPYEDLPFVCEVYSKANSIVLIDEPMYYYRCEPNQGSSTIRNDRKLFKLINQIQNTLEIVEKIGSLEYIREALFKHIYNCALLFVDNAHSKLKKELFCDFGNFFKSRYAKELQFEFFNNKEIKIAQALKSHNYIYYKNSKKGNRFKRFAKNVIHLLFYRNNKRFDEINTQIKNVSNEINVSFKKINSQLRNVLDLESEVDKLKQQLEKTLNFKFEINRLQQQFIKNEHNNLLMQKILKFKNTLKKPSVIFLVYHWFYWTMDSIYKELINNNFDVKIVVSPALDIDESLREKEMNDNFNFFNSKMYNVIKGYDFKAKTLYDLEKNLPDFIFYQTNQMQDYPYEFNIRHFYNKALCIIVPYNFFVANIQHHQFNENFYNLVWLNCVETKIEKKMFSKYTYNKGENILVTGYPKMDNLYFSNDKYSWKNFNNKKIIWLPNFSNNEEWKINNVNLDKYYQNFYEYIRDNKNVDILLSPNDFLKSKYIQTQINTISNSDFDNFVFKWKSLANGIYETKEDYLSIFNSSDALILDDFSFVGEYLYTKKPICFINRFKDREELLQHFTEFGQITLQNCYIAQSWDDVVNFINNVVCNGNDYMFQKRQDFYNKYLDENSGRVGYYIVSKIKEKLIL